MSFDQNQESQSQNESQHDYQQDFQSYLADNIEKFQVFYINEETIKRGMRNQQILGEQQVQSQDSQKLQNIPLYQQFSVSPYYLIAEDYSNNILCEKQNLKVKINKIYKEIDITNENTLNEFYQERDQSYRNINSSNHSQQNNIDKQLLIENQRDYTMTLQFNIEYKKSTILNIYECSANQIKVNLYYNDQFDILHVAKQLFHEFKYHDDQDFQFQQERWNKEKKFLENLNQSQTQVTLKYYGSHVEIRENGIQNIFYIESGIKNLFEIFLQYKENKRYEEYITLLQYSFCQLLNKLNKLHTINNIAHSDIKPENIILGYDFQFYFIDFGCSVNLNQDDQDLQQYLQGRTERYNLEFNLNKTKWNKQEIIKCDISQLILTFLRLLMVEESVQVYENYYNFKKRFTQQSFQLFKRSLNYNFLVISSFFYDLLKKQYNDKDKMEQETEYRFLFTDHLDRMSNILYSMQDIIYDSKSDKYKIQTLNSFSIKILDILASYLDQSRFLFSINTHVLLIVNRKNSLNPQDISLYPYFCKVFKLAKPDIRYLSLNYQFREKEYYYKQIFNSLNDHQDKIQSRLIMDKVIDTILHSKVSIFILDNMIKQVSTYRIQNQKLSNQMNCLYLEVFEMDNFLTELLNNIQIITNSQTIKYIIFLLDFDQLNQETCKKIEDILTTSQSQFFIVVEFNETKRKNILADFIIDPYHLFLSSCECKKANYQEIKRIIEDRFQCFKYGNTNRSILSLKDSNDSIYIQEDSIQDFQQFLDCSQIQLKEEVFVLNELKKRIILKIQNIMRQILFKKEYSDLEVEKQELIDFNIYLDKINSILLNDLIQEDNQIQPNKKFNFLKQKNNLNISFLYWTLRFKSSYSLDYDQEKINEILFKKDQYNLSINQIQLEQLFRDYMQKIIINKKHVQVNFNLWPDLLNYNQTAIIEKMYQDLNIRNGYLDTLELNFTNQINPDFQLISKTLVQIQKEMNNLILTLKDCQLQYIIDDYSDDITNCNNIYVNLNLSYFSQAQDFINTLNYCIKTYSNQNFQIDFSQTTLCSDNPIESLLQLPIKRNITNYYDSINHNIKINFDNLRYKTKFDLNLEIPILPNTLNMQISNRNSQLQLLVNNKRIKENQNTIQFRIDQQLFKNKNLLYFIILLIVSIGVNILAQYPLNYQLGNTQLDIIPFLLNQLMIKLIQYQKIKEFKSKHFYKDIIKQEDIFNKNKILLGGIYFILFIVHLDKIPIIQFCFLTIANALVLLYLLTQVNQNNNQFGLQQISNYNNILKIKQINTFDQLYFYYIQKIHTMTAIFNSIYFIGKQFDIIKIQEFYLKIKQAMYFIQNIYQQADL